MRPAFPASDYYGSSAPSRRHQPTTSFPARPCRGWDRRDGSHVHHEPIVRLGAQLCPCRIATTTPQTFTVASRPATSTGPRVPRPQGIGCARPPSPYPPDWSWWLSLEERSAAGFSRAPSGLACRTPTIWQCWPVPSLSGLLSTLTTVPWLRLPPASTSPLRQAGGGVLSSPLGSMAPRGARSPRPTWSPGARR